MVRRVVGGMSIIQCKQCDAFIDSDDDPDCFVYVGNYRRLHAEIILCEACREHREQELEAEDSQRALAEFQAEEQEQKK